MIAKYIFNRTILLKLKHTVLAEKVSNLKDKFEKKFQNILYYV